MKQGFELEEMLEEKLEELEEKLDKILWCEAFGKLFLEHRLTILFFICYASNDECNALVPAQKWALS